MTLRTADGSCHEETEPHVVILGAGFGGLYAARTLKRAALRITLVDQRNHHLFQPLLYQVATAGLSPGDIAYPIRSVVSGQKNARVWLAEAVTVEVKSRKVILRDGELNYDFLILATGARHAYFGHDQRCAIYQRRRCTDCDRSHGACH